MNAQQLIALADSLRSYALQSGHDLNDSNLFVHTMLMRAIAAEGASDTIDINREADERLDV
jgi:hypothetical protein